MKREMLIVNGGKITANEKDEVNEVPVMMPIGLDGLVPEQNKQPHSFKRPVDDSMVTPMLPAGFHIRDKGLDNI